MHSIWLNALKSLSLVFFIILINTKPFALAEETPDDTSNDDAFQIEEPEETGLAKRSWIQLHRSWGRNIPDEDQMKKAIRNYQELDYPDYDLPAIREHNSISNMDEFEGLHLAEKRAWHAINGAWGKRNLNRFRGTGKREPGSWNNLRGLWGKRSGGDPRNWNKLSQAWGK